MENDQSPPPKENLTAEEKQARKQDADRSRQEAKAKRRAEDRERRIAEERAMRTSVAGGAASSDIKPPARPARRKRRHWGLMLSFLLLVVAPAGGAQWYLWERAADQYASDIGFTVRREETLTAVEGLLGGFPGLSSNSSSDSDILYKFILSRELLEIADRRLNLREVYSRHHDTDPVFGLPPDASVEALLSFWQRMVRVAYAPGTGLLEIRTLAFTPEEAKQIAELIFEESSRMINDLSAIAREDSMRYAREELELTVGELSAARQAITAFRSRNQIVDPQADIQVQMGLLNTLQQQLAEELINYDLLRNSTRAGDPRLVQAEQRIDVIRARIAEERSKFGAGAATVAGEAGQDYATVIAEFERLTVEREFAEGKYTAALSNFDAAQASAQRQSRYLAAFVRPTLAQTAEHPKREVLLGLVIGFLVVGWSILALIYYSLRDRR